MRGKTGRIALAVGILGTTTVLLAFLQAKPDWSMLADEVLRNTPEHTHFVRGTTFSWCMFRSPKDDPLPEVTQAVLAKLRGKYVVYLSDSEIPDALRRFDAGRLVGYSNGFSFAIHIERLGPRVVKIHYSDWEGNLAASAHYKVYRWTGRSWRVVKKSAMLVSQDESPEHGPRRMQQNRRSAEG
jgi:hypothetical protein